MGSGPHRAPWAAVSSFLSKAMGSHGKALSREGHIDAIVLILEPVNKVPYTV